MAELTPAGWDGILTDDEYIILQGRPDTRFTLSDINMSQVIIGIIGAAMSGLWMLVMWAGGAFIAVYGLLPLATCMLVIVGAPIVAMRERRQTWYTLTNKRAFIAIDRRLQRRTLHDTTLTPDTPITFVDGPLASLYFAARGDQFWARTRSGRTQSTDGMTAAIGFERIADGRAVLQLVRQVQNSPDKGPRP